MSDAPKLCACCRHGLGYGPVKCAAFGKARLAYLQRATLGPCGPEARFFEARETTKPVVLPFPMTHRVSA